MPRSRIDSLLASFPKLIPANSQHTTVETEDVRFVYQPFEELYVLLITNKGSNILQVSLMCQISASARRHGSVQAGDRGGDHDRI
jgi:hypothetical protein